MQLLDNKYPNISNDMIQYYKTKGHILIHKNLASDKALFFLLNMLKNKSKASLLESINSALKH